MKKINLNDIVQYVENNINIFHEKRLNSLKELKLEKILARKNPYLFKAKYALISEQIIKSLADAHISSHEETIFGNWLEGLAIFINKKIYNGWKSGITGIDLEFDKEDKRYVVNIKSGPNWGNSSQQKKMEEDFKKATKTLRTSGSKLNVVAVNGCCYGKNNVDKGSYLKLCGQSFWEFISGDKNLYISIIEPLGHKSKEKNEDFSISYAQMINRFTAQFSKSFCDENGTIQWEKLVKYNSSKK